MKSKSLLVRCPRLSVFRALALACAAFLAATLAANAQSPQPSGTVLTIAGNGSALFSGDGGPATAAGMNPWGLAIGSDGTLSFSDLDNYRIRAINPATGIITTVAGNGSGGDTGNDGPATNAALGLNVGIAVDRARNALYLGDIDSDWVRRVDLTTGLLTRYAGTGILGFSGDGGPATSARLAQPDSVATDGFGKLSIADVRNIRVRQVDPLSGIITTIAGNGLPAFSGDGGPATAASFEVPALVAADSAGNVFVVDQGQSTRIRRIDVVTHIIATVAGGGTNLPGSGPATDMDLGSVHALAVDNAGTLFIANFTQVFKLDLATGLLSPFAGGANQGFSGDGGPALDALFDGIGGLTLAAGGGLIISDRGNNRIRYIVPDSIQLACNSAQTELHLPYINSLSGDLTVKDNPSVTNVNAGAVTSTGGGLNVSGNTSATGIELGSLNSAGESVNVSGNTSATGVSLGSLTNAGGSVNVSGNTSATGIGLGSLNSVGDSVNVSGNTSATGVNLGSLTNAGGSVNVSGNTSATGVNLGSLQSAGGLEVSGNTSATNINLGSLTNVQSTASSLAESAHLFGSTPAAADHFGSAVAVSSNVLVATAPEANLPGLADAGTAFLFTRDGGGNWSAPAQLTAGSFAGANFLFGQSVALDGDTLMVGAYDRLGSPGETWGAVYVFTRSGGTWPATPTQRLLSPGTNPPVNDFFGNAVAVSGDLAAIGEYLDSANLGDTNAVGAVHIFKRAAGVWSAVQTLTPPRPEFLGRFGASVALQGTNLLVGEPGADVTVCQADTGAVWVYALDASGTNFVQQARLTASDSAANDQFGQVALDGDTALIGAYSADAKSAADAGAAYIFTRTNGVWKRRGKLTAPTPQTNGLFGSSVALRGGVAVIGAPERPAGRGSVHTFNRIANGNWIYGGSLSASDGATGDEFGNAVAFDGQTAALGARMDNTAGGTDAGSVYVGTMTNGGGGDLVVSGNTSATHITILNFTSAGGSVDITGNTSATTIDLGSLTSAGGSVDITGNTSATTIDLVSLTSAGGSVDITANTSATTIDLGSLSSAGGSVDITGNDSATTIDLGSLASAGSIDITGNTSATTIDLVSLASAGGSVDITGNTSATTIDLGSLTSAGGSVDITGNDSATTIDLGSVTSVGGDLTVSSNAPNTVVNLSSLRSVGDGINAALITLQNGTFLFTNGLNIASNVWLTGSGTLAGNVTNAGKISPGRSPGRFDITGRLVLANSSELRLELGGYTPGSQYDFLNVTGNVTLGGTLAVSLINNFQSVMTNGASFILLTAGAPLTGAFANVASGGTLFTTDGYARFTVLYAGATSLQLTSLVIVDTDGDGLPDWWEDRFGLNRNSSADAALDGDGDGTSNTHEFQAGTVPTNAASVFRIVAIQRESNSVQLTWSTVGGKSYRVQTKSSVTDPFADLSPLITMPGTGEATTNLLDPGATTNANMRYYRVRLGP